MNPVTTQVTSRRSSANREIHTGDLDVGQAKDIVLDDDPIDREQIIVPVDGPLLSGQAQNLAFSEEPVTIRIERTKEKNAPKVVDAWVNGKGAEVLINGKFVEFGCLPVGLIVTTKRKYVEVLARSKTDSVSTSVVKRDDGEDNIVNRDTSSSIPFTVVQDKNPIGAEWLTRLLMEG